MKKRMKAVLLLIGAVVILTALYLVVSSLIPDDQGETVNGDLLVTDRNPDDIVKIEIKNEKIEYTLVKSGKTDTEGDALYTVAEASEFNYISTSLSGLAVNISRLVASRVVDEDAKDFDNYGLSQQDAAASVKATYSDGSSVLVYFGKQAPIGDDYYVREASSGTVYTISSGRAELFMAHYHNFRDTTLLPVVGESYENLQSVSIRQREGGELFIERYGIEDENTSGTGMVIATFRITKPILSYVDNMIVQIRLLEPIYEITHQTVIEDHPKNLSEYGLDKPFVLEIGLTSGSKTRLLIGHAIPDTETDDGMVSVFLMVEGIDTVHAVQGPFNFLRLDYRDILNTIIWSHNIKQVDKLEFRTPEKTYRFTVRDDKDFEGEGSFFATFNNKNIDEDSMRSIFMRMIQIYGEDRVGSDFSPTTEADYEMTITTRRGTVHVLRLMRINSRHYAAEVDGFLNYYINVSAIKSILDGLEVLERGEKLIN